MKNNQSANAYGWRGARATQIKQILAVEPQHVIEAAPRGAWAAQPDVETDPMTFEEA